MGITHMYHIPGLTDRETQKKQAAKRQNSGGTTWLHSHSRTEECTTDCELYEPTKE